MVDDKAEIAKAILKYANRMVDKLDRLINIINILAEANNAEIERRNAADRAIRGRREGLDKGDDGKKA